ncbi:putative N5,N10- methylenetetrahydromethanopterin reductase-related protein [marine gamma proteobacterium HTCC2143]|uniref:Putative N5,N10-methylenetetrahydromethanopterin reductase-related protein n=1 Tax=marine gamma proteobacterium HTCC2143 TaxID=247633 RepID=A0YBL6_9GAMM|nr:putative N5,N10- methylenetetrahydromethanopterin reductase-related protein [marine gamma proteobacterium HTCC2143]
MKTGVLIFATDYTIQMGELAKELEDRGFESLLVPEHTHIPASRKSAWPGGADLPKEYSHTYDPFVALSFAAAATKALKLGTGICLLPQRDTITTAKSVASLDRMSGGRFLFGIGGGWNVEEMQQHGTQYNERFAKMKEQVLAMKMLWSEEEAEFHGQHVNFEATWQHPKPLQTPPPVILGGETDYTLRRVVDYCEGWLPRARHGFDAAENIARLKNIADEAGRDMATLSVSVFGAPADQAILDSYRTAGIDRAILPLPSANRDKVLSILDSYTDLL